MRVLTAREGGYPGGCSGRSGLAAVLGILVLCHPVDAGRLDAVRVRTWDTVKDAQSFPPELADHALAVPWLQTRPSFGIAFSGGGTRSATATLGQLRALHDLGWIGQARYITANSGGTWTTVPFTYLPADMDEDRFLGAYVPPEDISQATLKPDDEDLDPLAMSTAIHNAGIGGKLLAILRGDETYSDIVGSIFLKPFGLHNNERLFTFHPPALEEILADNPRLDEGDFYIVERKDRPYLILVGTMLAEQHSKSPRDYFPVEISPLYTGIRQRFSFEKDREIVAVGGGYVESFGYDSYEPGGRQQSGRWKVGLKGRWRRGDNPFSDRYRFTLSDAIGVSSAAPLATLSGKRVPNLIFPELRHWPVDREAIDRADDSVRRKADEFQHGDGADIDNLAVMPLLVRGVENILVFINTAQPFVSPEAGCASISEQSITDDLVSLFRISGDLVHNVVIGNGEQELVNLCATFTRQKLARQPLVHCQGYDIVANPRHGIESYRADICWMYLDRVESWLERVEKVGDLNRKLHEMKRPFDTFPHYSTFAEQGALLIDLDRERVNALSNFTAWSVYDSVGTVREGLAGAWLTAPE